MVFAVVQRWRGNPSRENRPDNRARRLRECRFSTEGIQFLGIAPPKTSSTNSMPFLRSVGSNLDAANAELAVAAGLFLVLAFGVGFAADGFAIRNLGRLQREVDVVSLLQLRHNDFHVLLAVAGQQEFLGLWIAQETQRRIFLHDFVNGHADFVFIRARLRFDREGDRRLGQLRGLVDKWERFCRPAFRRSWFLSVSRSRRYLPACSSAISVSCFPCTIMVCWKRSSMLRL